MSNDASFPTSREQPADARLVELLRSLGSRVPNTVDESSSAARSEQPAQAVNNSAAHDEDTAAQARQQRREVQKRHATMLDGLVRNLDIVAYAQMSILYYMDNSLFRLLIRLVPHWLFFTPKPAAFPPPPRKRPYVVHVVFANLTCAMLHLMLAAPAANEASRGYLHGGFLIDFVGERGPVSKFRLLCADIAVLLVQVVLLAAVRERERLRDIMVAAASGEDARGGSAAEVGISVGDLRENAQDHDAEEQGVRRDEASEYLLPDEHREPEDLDGDDMGTSSSRATAQREMHPLDRFYTGQFVVADLYIWDAVRSSWKDSAE